MHDAVMPDALLQRIEPLLALAARAPSSHNSQPWRLRCLPAVPPRWQDSGPWTQALAIELDPARCLRALPALQREMLMSLGGFAAILLNLLRLSAWPVKAVPAEPSQEGQEGRLLLLLGDQPCAERVDHAGLARLNRALRLRHTERGPYLPMQGLRFHLESPDNPLPYTLDLQEPRPTLRWQAQHARSARAELAEFYARHGARDLMHPQAWAETYAHLNFAAEQPARPVPQGMPIERLFGPLPAWRRRLLQLLLHPRLLRGPAGRPVTAEAGRQLRALILSSPALLYLSTPRESGTALEGWLAGEAIARLWLAAADAGQALHPLSVALQHEDLAQGLAGLLGCRERLLFIARAGTPAQALRQAQHHRRAPSAFCVSQRSDASPCLPCSPSP